MKVTEIYGKNQLVISDGNKEVFQSYSSIIAEKSENGVRLSEHYDYSRTTMKYLKQFLGHGVAETRAKIKSGEYKLDLAI